MVVEHNLAQLSSAQLDKVINGVFVIYQMPQLSSAQLSSAQPHMQKKVEKMLGEPGGPTLVRSGSPRLGSLKLS